MLAVIGKKDEVIATDINLSLEVIYHRHYKSVYNYIAFRINNHYDAEELAGDVFVKAMQSIERYNPAYAMEAWLIGIAKNTVNDFLRKTMRRTFLPLDSIMDLVSPDKQPEAVAVINEESKMLMTAMVRLRDKERHILSLKFATELTHGEIAEILNISESHVGVTAHRAMKKLKKYFEEGAYER